MSKAEQAGKPRIAAGFRIGKLVVESPTDERKNGYTIWKCKCDCGNSICLDTRCLQRGTVCDCGCETKVKPGQKDLMGQRFGKLTAVDSAGYTGKGKTLVWRCLCDCGNEVMVEGKLLTGGKTKSCGCIGKTEQDNQIGKRFGQLVVTGYHGKKNRMHYWECLCDCGKTAEEKLYGEFLDWYYETCSKKDESE